MHQVIAKLKAENHELVDLVETLREYIADLNRNRILAPLVPPLKVLDNNHELDMGKSVNGENKINLDTVGNQSEDHQQKKAEMLEKIDVITLEIVSKSALVSELSVKLENVKAELTLETELLEKQVHVIDKLQREVGNSTDVIATMGNVVESLKNENAMKKEIIDQLMGRIEDATGKSQVHVLLQESNVKLMRMDVENLHFKEQNRKLILELSAYEAKVESGLAPHVFWKSDTAEYTLGAQSETDVTNSRAAKNGDIRISNEIAEILGFDPTKSLIENLEKASDKYRILKDDLQERDAMIEGLNNKIIALVSNSDPEYYSAASTEAAIDGLENCIFSLLNHVDLARNQLTLPFLEVAQNAKRKLKNLVHFNSALVIKVRELTKFNADIKGMLVDSAIGGNKECMFLVDAQSRFIEAQEKLYSLGISI